MTIVTFFKFQFVLKIYSCNAFLSLRLPFCNSTIVRIQVHKLMLFIVSVVLVTCWTVYRNESFAWILQDILSFLLRFTLARS